jgi:four helix bundle protein
MGLARSYRELEVYQLAVDLQQQVFAFSQRFPRDETYSLTDQIRRSSRSIGANIAESWAKRRYVAHFTSKLSDADGESNETRHWLDTALACGYLKRDEHLRLCQSYEQLGGMLGRMIGAPDSWCSRGCRPAAPPP